MYTSIWRVQRAKMKGDPTIGFAIYLQPLIFALLFGYLYHASGARSNQSFGTFIGVGQMAMWQVVLFAGGIIVRHEFNRERTIFHTMLTRISLYRIWCVRLLICMAIALPAFVVTSLVGILVFGVRPSVPDIPLLLVGIVYFCLSMYSISLPLVFLLFLTIHGGRVIQTLSYPIFLLSGMVVSIDHFPTWVQWVARMFPMTWSTHWIQRLLMDHRPVWSEFCGGLMVSAGYLFLSIAVYRLIMKKLRIRGDIRL